MFLDALKVPELHRLLASRKREAIEKLRGADISLTVSLFLALVHQTAVNEGDDFLREIITGLGLTGVEEAGRCISSNGGQPSTAPFGAPSLDFYRIGSEADVASEEWVLFYDRFRRSASGSRRSPMLRGVGGVLGEMGDNVVWHAFETRDNPCLAMAGFHVDGNIASFCVADFGQGFLRSLCRSERWRHLATDSEALEAVVRQRATSRPGEQTGDGFKRVFDSLVQFNGLVILRSGNCTYRLENAGGINQELIRESSSVPGSSVTVVIALEADPSEKKLRI